MAFIGADPLLYGTSIGAGDLLHARGIADPFSHARAPIAPTATLTAPHLDPAAATGFFLRCRARLARLARAASPAALELLPFTLCSAAEATLAATISGAGLTLNLLWGTVLFIHFIDDNTWF